MTEQTASRTHRNPAGVEFVTVSCDRCGFEHAHRIEQEAARPLPEPRPDDVFRLEMALMETRWWERGRLGANGLSSHQLAEEIIAAGGALPDRPELSPEEEGLYRWVPVKGDCRRHFGPHRPFRCNGALGALVALPDRPGPSLNSPDDTAINILEPYMGRIISGEVYEDLQADLAQYISDSREDVGALPDRASSVGTSGSDGSQPMKVNEDG